MNFAPDARLVSSITSPPCCFTIPYTIERPSPVPTPDRLRREKWIENSRRNLRRNAGAIVGYFQQRSDCPAGHVSSANPHVSLAAVLQQRLLRVHEQIQHHLLQLVRISHRFAAGRRRGRIPP